MALKNKWGVFAPVILLFLIVNALAIGLRARWAVWNVDQDVLIIGNLFLFLVTTISFLMAKRGLRQRQPARLYPIGYRQYHGENVSGRYCRLHLHFHL